MLTPFLSPLFLLYSILVSSFYLSVNIVVLYDSPLQAFYCLNAWNRLQRRKERICESRCQVSDCLHFFAEYSDLNPYPSATTVYPRSAFCTRPAFYSQSAVCILHSVCIYPWSAVRSPQSAVRSPQSAVRSPQSTVRSPQVYFTLTALVPSLLLGKQGGKIFRSKGTRRSVNLSTFFAAKFESGAMRFSGGKSLRRWNPFKT